MSVARFPQEDTEKWLNPDGTDELIGDWNVGAARKIECDQLAARGGVAYKLPISDGNNNEMLKTDGAGGLEWYAASEYGVYMPLSGGIFEGAVLADDHGAAANDEIVNVCYGTGSAPAANTTTIGALYFKYNA